MPAINLERRDERSDIQLLLTLSAGSCMDEPEVCSEVQTQADHSGSAAREGAVGVERVQAVILVRDV